MAAISLLDLQSGVILSVLLVIMLLTDLEPCLLLRRGNQIRSIVFFFFILGSPGTFFEKLDATYYNPKLVLPGTKLFAQ